MRLSLLLTIVALLIPAHELCGAELVHHWAFNGDTMDSSPSGNHGEAFGDTSFTDGIVGQALLIDELDDLVENDDAANLPIFPDDTWSLNVWYNLESFPSLAYGGGFGGRNDDTRVRSFLSFGPEGGGEDNAFYFWGSNIDVYAGEDYDTDGNWHMYTITFDGELIQMYEDGAEVLSTDVDKQSDLIADEFFSRGEIEPIVSVGGPSHWNQNILGAVDEFTIWNGALTAAEIESMFASPGGGGGPGAGLLTDPALVGVWLFDEGSGDVVGDISGNGNEGTIFPAGADYVWEEGKFGSAIVVTDPGDGSIDVEDSDSLAEITEAMTVAAWFRVDEDSDTGIRKQGAFLLEDQSGGEPVSDAFAACFWTDAGVNCFFGQTELEQGVWNHVAATYDGEFVEIYVNGEPESEIGLLARSGEEIDAELSGEILLGEGNPLQLKYAPETYIGGIDEVVLFKRALSQGEIQALMAGWENLDAGGSALQAGDADQDFDFDQLDLVQVQIAAKYLTGQPATWGEGDWDGAPGGTAGDPPAGDGLFDQLDIIAALNAGIYLAGPYNAIAKGGTMGDGQTSIVYDAASGEVSVDAPAGTELTSINIDSAAGIFTGEAAQSLGGSFDNDADSNIFKATFGSSFGSLSFGNVAQAGLSEEFVANDLTVIGSLAGGGDLGNVDLIYVPEPSTLVLLTLGLVGVTYGFRQRSRHVT